MRKCKALICALLCAAVCLSAAGCYGDTTVAAYYKDKQMPAGVYISYLFQSYTEIEAKKTVGDEAYKETLGGKSQKEWIIDRTKEYVRQYYAVQDRFEELGLQLTSADEYEIQERVNETLEMMDLLYQKYGISNESIYLNAELSHMATLVFEEMYGPEGERAIPEDEVNQSLSDNYANIKYLSVPLLRSRDKAYSEEDLKVLVDKVQEYVDRANAGEMFDELVAQYKEFQDQYDAMLDAIDAGETPDRSFMAEEKKVTVATQTNAQFTQGGSANETVVENDETELFIQLHAMPLHRAQMIYEEGYYLFMVVRLDILSNPTLASQYRTPAMSRIKNDEFKAYLSALGDTVQVTYNEGAVRRYNPDRMF